MRQTQSEASGSFEALEESEDKKWSVFGSPKETAGAVNKVFMSVMWTCDVSDGATLQGVYYTHTPFRLITGQVHTGGCYLPPPGGQIPCLIPSCQQGIQQDA